MNVRTFQNKKYKINVDQVLAKAYIRDVIQVMSSCMQEIYFSYGRLFSFWYLFS